MKPIGKGLIPSLERNTALVEREALLVFKVGPSAVRECLRSLESCPRLSVIGVLGPPPRDMPVDGLQEMVLCEVGVNRTRPYRKSEKPQGTWKPGEEHECFPIRHKVAGLSEAQHREVAPHIFGALQKMVDAQVSTYERGLKSPYLVKGRKGIFSARRDEMYERDVFRPAPLSLRFSVSWEDKFLIRDIFWADIFWAEIYGNEDLEGRLIRFARWISSILAPHQGGWEGELAHLPHVWNIQESIEKSKFLKHVLVEMLVRHLPGGEKSPFFEELGKMIGWDFKETREHRMASLVLPDPERRLGKSQIRVVRMARDYLVFELFASMQPKPLS